eukprot:1160049-Pelagomonas_calceolata.AAC.2
MEVNKGIVRDEKQRVMIESGWYETTGAVKPNRGCLADQILVAMDSGCNARAFIGNGDAY